ncbi:D-2-hydroxyacid dehydrogenase [Sphingomonas metalli]|uniref:D-2-hydroxyacid dehydrogenase n=1 Tax=Sphingomonas metalli TaxID=1779358 RepID=A0A916SY97_9SPHN|nr:FAD-binding oxidoreductase [Sphingomonas metalli]GGB21976.1 D-2-hydroxyacid dehydrogenase [Sphingomonas metalli]
MTPAQTAMVADLSRVLDPAGIVTDPAAIAPWTVDWRQRWKGVTPAILAPRSTAEVAEVVRAAARHRVPLVPQGGNSSMVGGATPPEDGSALILSLRRMTAIRSLSPSLAVAEAGVILQTLNAAALTIGSRFPLTLGARGSATVGGLVSTNAGGTQVLRFGTMRGLVAGVEAVLADGTVHDGTGALAKDNRGYSLDQLLIGAEGTLGVVTAAALRLVPAVVARAVAWAGVADPAAALALLRRFQAAGDAVESFEILPAETLDAALAHLPDARAPLHGRHPWHLLIEATAASAEVEPPAAFVERVLAQALSDGLVADATIAASEAQAEAFWRLRDSLSDAERAQGPATQHDIAVPVDAMPRFMVEAAAACEARFPGTRASGFGHLGDGNIHFHVRAPRVVDRDRWFGKDAPAISRFVHDLVTQAGGTISAEHGIGQMKREELARLAPPGRLAALAAIKGALDPLGILNPGKLLAPASPPQ